MVLGRVHMPALLAPPPTLTLSGLLALLPMVLMLALAVLDPAPMRLLFTTPMGWAILGLLVALEATGFLLIRRIVSIDL